ncbi:MAG: hypothetical protein AVDCRST_MAG30-3114, partial [uncultured Solirubrobacteraceae bacterium]
QRATGRARGQRRPAGQYREGRADRRRGRRRASRPRRGAGPRRLRRGDRSRRRRPVRRDPGLRADRPGLQRRSQDRVRPRRLPLEAGPGTLAEGHDHGRQRAQRPGGDVLLRPRAVRRRHVTAGIRAPQDRGEDGDRRHRRRAPPLRGAARATTARLHPARGPPGRPPDGPAPPRAAGGAAGPRAPRGQAERLLPRPRAV